LFSFFNSEIVSPLGYTTLSPACLSADFLPFLLPWDLHPIHPSIHPSIHRRRTPYLHRHIRQFSQGKMAPARNTRHSFRLPSLHRLNTKDISSPSSSPVSKTAAASGPYHPLATPPLPKTPPHTAHTHHAGPSSTDVCCISPGSNPTLSPSSTVSSSASPASFSGPYAYATTPLSTSSLHTSHLAHPHHQQPNQQQQHLPHRPNASASCASNPAPLSLSQSPPSAALPHANSNANSTPSSSPGNININNSNNSVNNNRIRTLLQLRRKHSRIDIEREMLEEREQYGGGGRRCSVDGADALDVRGSGGMLDVMEPRPRPGPGVRGSGGIGGIFEVLEG
ncbi:hypothetical protein IWX50DRAFT_689310, partial [Phyllosticta citricarpa]